MRIALDSTPLTLTSGGLQRYVSALSAALKAEFPEDDYHLLANPTAPADAFERRWWTLGLPRELRRRKIEIFHGTNFEVPYLGRIPAVITIHDLSPWRDAAWHHAADRVRQRTPWLIRLGRVNRIITPSEAIRREVIAHFRFDPAKVRAIPLAAGPDFRPVNAAPLHPRPYFLFTGTLEPRKNIPALIEAWQRAKTDADLVLIGRKRADAPALPDLPGLHWLGELPDAQLPAYYSQALAFVYPSHYEGFGLPVLEAMQCGCPVVISKDPALVELSAGIAAGPGQLADSMRQISEDPSLRSRIRIAGLTRALQFSWAETARLTHQVYRETIAV